ncbi:DUF1565 domain-containing protein [Candidatus Poribacteria bacterium]|nr:DUF1565 domain-containing protein [Candidatus Poribacteria bacterium]
MTGDVIVPREVTLKIEPGTAVRFDGFYGLVVQGVLNATGTPNNPILFTSHQSTPQIGSWKGIQFNTENKNILRYARVEDADVGINCSLSSPQITDNWIINNRTGISLNVSSASIRYNLIQSNMIGIDVANAPSSVSVPIKVTNNIIAQNENGVVTNDIVDTGSFQMNQNNIVDNLEYGIFVKGYCGLVGARGRLDCPAIDAHENWWGSADPGEIVNQIFDNEDFSRLHSVIYIPYATSEISGAGPRL